MAHAEGSQECSGPEQVSTCSQGTWVTGASAQFRAKCGVVSVIGSGSAACPTVQTVKGK